MASSAGASILIVEDEAELRNLFALILEMEGFTVLQAADGQKGSGYPDVPSPGRSGW